LVKLDVVCVGYIKCLCPALTSTLQMIIDMNSWMTLSPPSVITERV